jgi:hypothetical protein
MLLCKQEYSYNQLGMSEFDLIGCYDRAVIAHNNNNNNNTDINQGPSSNVILHFEDVFHYYYHKQQQEDDAAVVAVDDVKSSLTEEVAIIRRGMERQMQHHQELYLPLTTYSPDIFNVHHSSSTTTSLQINKKITEADMSKDIRKHILGMTTTNNDDVNDTDVYDNDEIIETNKVKNNSHGNLLLHSRVAPFDYGNFYKLHMNWTEAYLKPLALKTCIGRIVKCLLLS